MAITAGLLDNLRQELSLLFDEGDLVIDVDMLLVDVVGLVFVFHKDAHPLSSLQENLVGIIINVSLQIKDL